MRNLLLLSLLALLLASCHMQIERPPFYARFTNMLYTVIQIQVEGYGSKTVSPGQTASFRIDRNDQSYHYEASTHGSSASGAVLGLVLEWSGYRDISGESYTHYLITLPDMFFLKMRNTGWHDLHPLYVNYGLADQTVDDIIIPGNGITYNTGYYRAYGSTLIQANWMDMPTDYTYWQNQVHFHFPWTENQYILLQNYFKQNSAGQDIHETSFETGSNPLEPRGNEPFGIDAATAKERTGDTAQTIK